MCDICNTIIEPVNMPSHINGKKHQKRLKEIEESDKNRDSAVQASGMFFLIRRVCYISYLSEYVFAFFVLLQELQ